MSDPRGLLVTTTGEILIALLEGERMSSEIAGLVGITDQHVSRLLPRLVYGGLIESRFPDTRRLSRLTPKGRKAAEHLAVVKELIGDGSA